MQHETVHRRNNGVGDIDRWHQEVLSRRAQTRTRFFRVARPLIGTLAIIAAYISAVRLVSPLPAAAEVPEAIAGPGEIPVATVHAVGTKGGSIDTACDSSGAFLSVPYTADVSTGRRRINRIDPAKWRM